MQNTSFPLSISQRGRWLAYNLNLDAQGEHNVVLTASCHSQIDVEMLSRALRHIVFKFPILRVAIRESEGELEQTVLEGVEDSVRVHDLSGVCEPARENFIARDCRRPFDLSAPPLVRISVYKFSATEAVISWVFDHIVVDGWSFWVLVAEMDRYLSSDAAPNAEISATPDYGYFEFIKWQQEWLRGAAAKKAENYWKGVVPAQLETLSLYPPATKAKLAQEKIGLSIYSDRARSLHQFSEQSGCTLFAILLSLFKFALWHLGGADGIAVGTMMSGRPKSKWSGSVGDFANPVVIATEFKSLHSLWDLVASVHTAVRKGLVRQSLPFALVNNALRSVSSGANSSLFQATFVLQNFRHSGDLARTLDSESPPIKWGGLELSEFPVSQSGDIGQAGLLLDALELPDRILLEFRFDQSRYSSAAIARLAKTFQRLAAAVGTEDVSLSLLAHLVAEPDLEPILRKSSPLLGEPRDHISIHSGLKWRAHSNPNAIALTWRGESLTYGQLLDRATRIADGLSSLGVVAGDRVAICISPCFSLVVCQLAVLLLEAVYVPIDPTSPPDRISYILDKALPSAAVSDSSRDLQPLCAELPCIKVDLDGCETCERLARRAQNRASAIPRFADATAYIIFTSGSTGHPKGVVVTHFNVAALLRGTEKLFDLGANDVWLLFHSCAFDFSVWEIWGCLLTGGRLVIADRNVVSNSEKVYDLICNENITILNQTPGAFRDLLPAQRRSGSSHSLRLIIFGGEALSIQSLRAWVESNDLTKTALVNMYGITETTVHSTYLKITNEIIDNATGSVIGEPLPHVGIGIFRSKGVHAPIGVTGEIYVSGHGLSPGYFNLTSLTDEKFIESEIQIDNGSRPLRWYKSGDLGRWLPDGNIEYLGRADNQVKLRGFRIELGEIEGVLHQDAQVAQAVVTLREDSPGDKRLVAYVVGKDGLSTDIDALRTGIRSKLPEYMVPAAFVLLEDMPLTPNGKVDRKALPAPGGERQVSGEYVEPRTDTEKRLAAIWAEVLKVDRVGVHDNFFELGGHSLLATRVTSLVSREFKRDVPLRAVFESVQLEAFAAYLDSGVIGQAPIVIPLAPRDQAIALSFAQQRLWFLDQYDAGDASYSIPLALRLRGAGVSAQRLRGVFNELIERHESLRTVFAMSESVVQQVILERLDLDIEVVEMSAQSLEEREERVRERILAEAVKPFDLSQGPLLRVSLLHLGDEEHVLLLTLHHIISDGWSMGVLVNDVVQIYKAHDRGEKARLPELPIQYADYAVWQRDRLQGEYLQEQLRYWKDQLSGAPALLELPTDRPRPALQSHKGAACSFELSKDTTIKLKALALAQERGATLFMVLEAAFKVLLHRYSGQEDICVGTPIAGRNRAETELLIGLFLNTLILRTRIDPSASFALLLEQSRRTALEAYEHQDVPFEKLVEELKPQRSLSYSPLFQVMFVLQNAPMERLEIPGLSLELMSLHNQTAKFDLTCSVTEGLQTLAGRLEYNTDLFDEATIQRLAKHYEVLLDGICADPGARIQDLPVLTNEERHRILVEWNDTRVEYPKDKAIHQLFEDQVQRNPSAIAAVYEDCSLSYGELNQKANQLARHLRGLGVGPEVLVGICMERSLEMVVGLLGILKAGGAYVPMDPSYPKDRLAYMLADAAPKVLLTQERLLQALPHFEGERLCLDRDWAAKVEQHADGDLPNLTGPHNLAYVIYTSGSTGQPKGVMVEHGGLNNFLAAMADISGTCSSDAWLAVTSLSFDIAGLELYLPLRQGARVVVASRGDAASGERLAHLIESCGITAVQGTPSTWRLMQGAEKSRQGKPALRIALCGGEAWDASLGSYIGSIAQRVWNVYGPTESTIWSSRCEVQPGRDFSLGQPIANTQIYILDEGLRPVPIGVAGELHIGGDGLARGYINRPELTQEKFISDPFGSDPGARLYKTGDVARYLPDGNIEYLGRADNQVKLRGFRIELGEIEGVLHQDAQVAQAVVTLREDSPGDKRLVAYVVAREGEPATSSTAAEDAIALSLFYFGASTFDADDKYEFYLKSAQFADQNGFEAVWTPERHFHEVGCLYPNPSVLNAALSTVTSRVHLRAGSVVLPLHDPIRVAEEWAVVDNLSRGRVGVAIASGWHPRDFVLSPQHYDIAQRKQVVQDGIATLRALWSGESIVRTDGVGQESTIHVFPRPIQSTLPLWITSSGNPDTFVQAGKLGANLLTHLLGQTIEEMAKNISRYRSARAEYGHDPRAGKVTVMVHTLIGDNLEETIERARKPFMEYMRSHLGLLDAFVNSLDIKVPVSGERDLENIVSFAFERYTRTASLIGTPQSCLPVYNQLRDAGVNEIACLVDWIDTQQALDGLSWITRLRDHARRQGPSPQSLLTRLKAQLPDYMVPAAITVLKRLPLTPNGKVDRKALPKPDGQRHTSTEYVEPITNVEKTIAAIWQDLLKVDKVGLHDNFFELGGHSLAAAQLIGRLEKALSAGTSLRAIFETPTVAGLANLIEQEALAGILLEGARESTLVETFEF